MNHWQKSFNFFFILERALYHASVALTDGSVLNTLLHNAALVISWATERERGAPQSWWTIYRCEVKPHSCWWPPSCSVMYLIPKAINKVMLIRYGDSADIRREIYHKDKCISALECIYCSVNKYFTSSDDQANVGQQEINSSNTW